MTPNLQAILLRSSWIGTVFEWCFWLLVLCGIYFHLLRWVMCRYKLMPKGPNAISALGETALTGALFGTLVGELVKVLGTTWHAEIQVFVSIIILWTLWQRNIARPFQKLEDH